MTFWQTLYAGHLWVVDPGICNVLEGLLHSGSVLEKEKAEAAIQWTILQ